jgi:hypothetical protein
LKQESENRGSDENGDDDESGKKDRNVKKNDSKFSKLSSVGKIVKNVSRKCDKQENK